ncbi:hypothetical protein [Bacillus cereus]|uniref:hypothetical protein n=1 Tax=Bacillus cereus TaxID=1396 RepID=UPI001F5556B9|nr:hypothetical protein [Bacillus cereus]
MNREFLQNDQYLYNGYRVKAVGKLDIYLVDRVMKRYITNSDTYNRIFKHWDGGIRVSKPTYDSKWRS